MNLIEHPRLTAEKAYRHHKVECPLCNIPPDDGDVVRVMDLCGTGRELWANARGHGYVVWEEAL